MLSIDLNCDMGEGIGNDHLIMPYISSANIACGFHAGDEDTMKRTMELALQHDVAIGAHPSFKDKENFGRTEMKLSNKELYELIAVQMNQFQKIAATLGAVVRHVKLHGALYNMAARDEEMSNIIAKAVKEINADLILYGLSGSYLISEAKKLGLQTASEVFADRTYQDDGSLTPRSQPNALLESEDKAIKQVLQMIDQQRVISRSGKFISIKADTVCIHGDGKHAVDFARKIHQTLKGKGIAINAI